MVISQSLIKKYYKQAYRSVGKHKHSAVKICHWCKKSLRNGGECYKNKFYGISTHRCIQMTPASFWCNLQCLYCWRDHEGNIGTNMKNVKIDRPKDILDGCIKVHKELLQGFWGNPKTDKAKMYEAERPQHIAISLDGEVCLYERLPELVDEIIERKMTAFIVSNGTVPEMIKKLIEHQPTNIYITLPAPNEAIYKKTCRPLIKDGWERINESLALLKNFSCNTVIRLTLVKGLNFVHPEQYAKIIEKSDSKFVEVKSFMSVGFSRQRLPYAAMPLHPEIKAFAKKIAEASGYSIKNEQKESRVVLLSK